MLILGIALLILLKFNVLQPVMNQLVCYVYASWARSLEKSLKSAYEHTEDPFM